MASRMYVARKKKEEDALSFRICFLVSKKTANELEEKLERENLQLSQLMREYIKDYLNKKSEDEA